MRNLYLLKDYILFGKCEIINSPTFICDNLTGTFFRFLSDRRGTVIGWSSLSRTCSNKQKKARFWCLKQCWESITTNEINRPIPSIVSWRLFFAQPRYKYRPVKLIYSDQLSKCCHQIKFWNHDENYQRKLEKLLRRCDILDQRFHRL